jgi:hypothetical protein
MTMTEADSLVGQLTKTTFSTSATWANLLKYLNLANLEERVFSETSNKSIAITIKNAIEETPLGDVKNLLGVLHLCLKHHGLVDFFSEDEITIMLNSLLSVISSDELEIKILALMCFSSCRISCNTSVFEKLGSKFLSTITNSLDTEGIEILSLTAISLLFKYSEGLIKETSRWYKYVFPLLFHSSKEVQQHADSLLNALKVNLDSNDICQSVKVCLLHVSLGQFKF